MRRRMFILFALAFGIGVAIKSYCGMGETEKANALFAKMTDPTGIDEAVKRCGEWNVKLAKSP